VIPFLTVCACVTLSEWDASDEAVVCFKYYCACCVTSHSLCSSFVEYDCFVSSDSSDYRIVLLAVLAYAI